MPENIELVTLVFLISVPFPDFFIKNFPTPHPALIRTPPHPRLLSF